MSYEPGTYGQYKHSDGKYYCFPESPRRKQDNERKRIVEENKPLRDSDGHVCGVGDSVESLVDIDRDVDCHVVHIKKGDPGIVMAAWEALVCVNFDTANGTKKCFFEKHQFPRLMKCRNPYKLSRNPLL